MPPYFVAQALRAVDDQATDHTIQYRGAGAKGPANCSWGAPGGIHSEPMWGSLAALLLAALHTGKHAFRQMVLERSGGLRTALFWQQGHAICSTAAICAAPALPDPSGSVEQQQEWPGIDVAGQKRQNLVPG